MKNTKKFTLLELLMIVAIIAILMSMLLPVLKSTKEKAKEIGCNSNLKQLGIVHMTYAGDSGDWLIPCSDRSMPVFQQFWNHRLRYFDYVSGKKSQEADSSPILRCPATTAEKLTSDSGSIQRAYCYGANLNLMGLILTDGTFLSAECKSHKFLQVKRPASCIMIGDVGILNSGENYPLLTYHQAYAFGDPHNNHSNILWVDGHVNSEQNAQLKFKYTSYNAPPWAANGENITK